MDQSEAYFLEALRCALHGEKNSRPGDAELYRLASAHHILPLIADSLPKDKTAAQLARKITLSQAQRTAGFLLVLEKLAQRGLHPVVVKGIVCRSLYPQPEQRPSVDEDLLILAEDFSAYRAVLEAEGLVPDKEPGDGGADYELNFADEKHQLQIELHTSLFPPESEAYGDCGRYFEGALERAVERRVRGVTLRTLAPTDHMLFLICHAYKHFLHAGVGIRQVCDMALMAEKDGEGIDWARVDAACRELHIEYFAAALFRIGEKYLGFEQPDVFRGYELDEGELLEDILSGGLYGVEDIDRAHSSTMTLEAAAAGKSRRRRRGALHSVFLPLKAMQGHFPYLREKPWLLPVAWTQRVYRYLTRKKNPSPVSPSNSVRIAHERIRLMEKYHMIEKKE